MSAAASPRIASREDSFVDALSLVCPQAATPALRACFRRVTPPATTWCVELDDRSPERPDFSFATKAGVDLPASLRETSAFRQVERIVSTDAGDGRWFFEVDLGAGGTDVHVFARLRPAFRPVARILERLRASGEPALARAHSSLAAFSRGCAALFELSDVGIVNRGGRSELRLGALPPAAHFTSMLSQAGADVPLLEAAAALIPAVVAPDRAVLQLALRDDELGAMCTGLEIGGLAQQGWTELLSELVRRDWLRPSLAHAARAWPGQVRLARGGGGWPPLVVREISHVKLVSRDGRLATKVYLVASETFSLFD